MLRYGLKMGNPFAEYTAHAAVGDAWIGRKPDPDGEVDVTVVGCLADHWARRARHVINSLLSVCNKERQQKRGQSQ
jgi:hypothetical protein